MELPDIPALALGLGRETHDDGRRWIEALAETPAERLAELGAAFLQRTAVQRKTGKPYYIDKLPNNWLYIAFIRVVLPNAKIVDTRRHPLDCCFSNFRQHYAKGQAFSYGLADVGAYYRDYVRLMAHIDAVQPGRVHRVIHEALLDEPEDRSPRAAGLSGPAVRGRLPRVPQQRARGAYRVERAGAPADQPRRRRTMAAL